MSKERVNPSIEHSKSTSSELESARTEKLSELREAFGDKDPTEHAETRADKARDIIDRQTKDTSPAHVTEKEASAPHVASSFIDHHLNYTLTLASLQRRLSPVSRNFSKIIHAPLVEKTSEVLETTVARPSVLLGTTWTALLLGTIFYLTARHFGYSLSGSELLFSFVVGALLGLLFEGFWRSITRRR